MRTTALALSCVACLLSLAPSAPALAAVPVQLYVNGNTKVDPSHQTGSPGNPFGTIGQAMQAAHARDATGAAPRPVAILVRPGLYDEAVTLDRPSTSLIALPRMQAELAQGVTVTASDVEVLGFRLDGGSLVQSPGYGSGQPYPLVEGVVFSDLSGSSANVFFVGASVSFFSCVLSSIGGAGADATLTGKRPVIEVVDSVLAGPSGNAVTLFDSFEQDRDGASGEFSLRIHHSRLSGALTNPPEQWVSDGHLVEIAARIGAQGATAFDVELTDNELGASGAAPLFFIGGVGAAPSTSTAGQVYLAGNRFTAPHALTGIFDFAEWKDVATNSGTTNLDPYAPVYIWNARITVDDPDGLLGERRSPPSQLPTPAPPAVQRAACDYLSPTGPAFCVDPGPADHGNGLKLSRKGER